MPTITLDEHPFDNASTHRHVFGTYTLPASYATGGEALTGGDLKNLRHIEKILFEPATDGTDLRFLRYDYTNQKVKVFDEAGAEIGNGTDLSAYAAGFVAFGR